MGNDPKIRIFSPNLILTHTMATKDEEENPDIPYETEHLEEH